MRVTSVPEAVRSLLSARYPGSVIEVIEAPQGDVRNATCRHATEAIGVPLQLRRLVSRLAMVFWVGQCPSCGRVFVAAEPLPTDA
jgi:hypothetical protein